MRDDLMLDAGWLTHGAGSRERGAEGTSNIERRTSNIEPRCCGASAQFISLCGTSNIKEGRKPKEVGLDLEAPPTFGMNIQLAQEGRATGLGGEGRRAAVCVSRFTLIEMVIAVAIFATLVTVVGGAMFGIMKSWDQQRIEAQRMEALVSFDRTLERLFSNAAPMTWPGDGGAGPLFWSGEAGRCRFCYRHRPGPSGAFRFCELELDGENLVVYYADSPSDSLGKRSVLATGVEQLELSYASYDRDNALSFVPEAPSSREMPTAIRVQIKWKDGRESTWLRRIGPATFYLRGDS